ncbi:MAG: RluA family pseudouridine synthase [Bacteroidales bacterium]|jgi:23S rRNA pseudouridine1911/1915/1917 synthase|nr:RluA family pseudouridine synthase [Bacteroidales bacterium]
MGKRDENIENEELFEHYRIEADAGQKALRIDKFLFNRIDSTSRTRIQNAALAGNIMVNEKAVKANYKVKPGDVIQVLLAHPPRETELLPEKLPLDIRYEDEAILIVNKEAGMVVHPGTGNYSGTLVNALMYHLGDIALFKSGEMRPGLVHRIDKNTSGLLVIAKTEYALNNLGRQFYEHSTGRKYAALVWGNPGESGTVTGNIGRSPRNRKIMHVFTDGSEGKPAITHYRLIEDLSYVSLLECELETGRTHQIRVHMSYIKHPLFNDPDYGGDKILRGTTFTRYQQFIRNCFNILPRQALHAKYLSFNHPVSGKRMEFESELPDDMSRVLEKWRNYIVGREN